MGMSVYGRFVKISCCLTDKNRHLIPETQHHRTEKNKHTKHLLFKSSVDFILLLFAFCMAPVGCVSRGIWVEGLGVRGPEGGDRGERVEEPKSKEHAEICSGEHWV